MKISRRLGVMPKGIHGMYELIFRRLGPRKTQQERELFGPEDDMNSDENIKNIRKKSPLLGCTGRQASYDKRNAVCDSD
jgi:hypothetical protein